MRHLPSPPQLGLDPVKFPAWRAHQDTGIITIHEAPTKFVGILAPTGFGKSAMIVGHALWSGKRVLIVTANRGLMAQYEADFGPMLAVIKGQSNYNCEIAMVTVDHAPCHAGQLCELKQAGCSFFGATGAKQMAKDAQLVLTNYQFLFHSMKEIEGIGHFDLVCYDECFVGETLVETPTGSRRIDMIETGEVVYNACGVAQVTSTFRKVANEIYQIELSNGTSIKCTGDHPFFTADGWTEARALESGDCLFSPQDVSAVWGGVWPQEDGLGEVSVAEEVSGANFLQQVLLQEVQQPNAPSSIASKDDSNSQTDRPHAFYSGGQREGADGSTTDDAQFAPVGLGGGGNRIRGGQRIPNSLQGRYPQSQEKNWHRDRREKSHDIQAAGARSQEGRVFTGIRVQSVARVECGRGVFVYNLRVASHPSYFAGGVLVHNCHQAPRELSKFLSIGVSRRESRDILKSDPGDDWNIWAQGHLRIVTRQLSALKKKKGHSPQLVQEVHQYRGLRRKLATLARAHTDRWVMTPGHFYGEMNWDCIRPAGYAKFYMWKRADKFLLTSASARPYLFPTLGVKSDLVTWKEFPSSIPVERRPVYYYPVIKYHAYSSDEEIRYLIAVMDQIIERRRDRKGTINSVSYERAAMFKANSKFGHYMITHSNADELPGAIAKFAAAKAPAILVSPSISEGYNFAYTAAEYTIIPKVPFSDTRSPIHQARAKTDRHYGILETCVEIRQSVGRIVRADDDQGEAFILDEQFGWVYRQHRRFFPADFIAAVKPIQYLPAPPRRLK